MSVMLKKKKSYCTLQMFQHKWFLFYVLLPSLGYLQQRDKYEGTTKAVVEGKELAVVIRDSNVEDKFVRISGIPQNLELGVVQTCLREFGTVIDMRWVSEI